MSFCPECEYEYENDLAACPECGTPLVDTLDAGGEYICDECKEPLKKDAPWCPECGTIFIETLQCFKHPAASAHGRCVVCGQHLCLACASQHMRRNFCEQDAQVGETMEETPAGANNQDWEAVNLNRFLKRGGVASRLFMAQDARRIVSRVDAAKIKVVAPLTMRNKVIRIFKERDMEDRMVAYECERCSAICSRDEISCPNCGKAVMSDKSSDE